MDTYKGEPICAFETIEKLHEWLDQNGSSAKALWIMFAKKGSGVSAITYEQARDTAIAHGWIDGLLNTYDERYFIRRFTPRKPKSGWSKINREVAEALIARGEMRPSGLEHVDAAKQDGRWERAYDSQSRMTVPDDFNKALKDNPTAAEFFSRISSAHRYAILFRLQTAQNPEQRSARIEKFIAMLQDGQTLHPGQ